MVLKLFSLIIIDCMEGGSAGGGKIVYLTHGIMEEGVNEAVRKSMLEISKRTARAKEIVSYERKLEAGRYENGIHFSARSELPKLLAELKPDLIHLFNPDLDYYKADIFDFRIIHTLSSNCPLKMETETETGKALKERTEYSLDQGELLIVPETERILKRLESGGIRCYGVVHPGIDLEHFRPRQVTASAEKERAGRKFRVGFASSPFEETGWKSRGIDLLLSAAAVMKDVEFRLAWREFAYSRVVGLVNARGLGNVQVINGDIDMLKFYEEVDATIVPFVGSFFNHDAPLSAIEGMAMGKPAVITEDVGLSDMIAKEGAGAVCKAEISSLVEGIGKLKADYESCSKKARGMCEKYFDIKKQSAAYEGIYGKHTGGSRAISLNRWKKALEAANRQLVIGAENIKDHYTRQETADEYDETRFRKFPYDVLFELEKNLVKAALADYIRRNRIEGRPKALDIATGTGRMLEVLEPLCDCIGMDNSQKMLEIARQKFPKAELLERDWLDMDFAGQFDVITCMRLLRHYRYPERKMLYKKIGEALKPSGICFIDFPSRDGELPIRDREGWDKYDVYDVFWTPDTLESELRNNGFKIVSSFGTGGKISLGERLEKNMGKNGLLDFLTEKYYYLQEQMESRKAEKPLHWIVAFSKLS